MRTCRGALAILSVLGIAVLAWAADTQEKADLKLSKEEQAILDLTNQARAKEKLAPLKPNRALCEAARAHSKNMARKHKLAHVLDDKTPAQRIGDAGYQYRAMGENIASGDNVSPKVAFQLWMDDPPHRDNILKPEFTEIGIGVAANDDSEVYYTQDFGTRRDKGNR